MVNLEQPGLWPELNKTDRISAGRIDMIIDLGEEQNIAQVKSIIADRLAQGRDRIAGTSRERVDPVRFFRDYVSDFVYENWGVEKFVNIGLPAPKTHEFGAGWDQITADLFSGAIEGVLNGRNFNKPDVIEEFRRVHFFLIQKY